MADFGRCFWLYYQIIAISLGIGGLGETTKEERWTMNEGQALAKSE
jgi:hypothetical protein